MYASGANEDSRPRVSGLHTSWVVIRVFLRENILRSDDTATACFTSPKPDEERNQRFAVFKKINTFEKYGRIQRENISTRDDSCIFIEICIHRL